MTFGGAPIIVDFYGWDEFPDIRQTVTFENCIFENMGISQVSFPADYIDPPKIEFPTGATIILATTVVNTVILRDSIFRNNTVIDDVRCKKLAVPVCRLGFLSCI